MTHNRNRVEHAVTETLNQMQLDGGKRAIIDQVAELRASDPRHFNENFRAYQRMTNNIPGLPQVDIGNDGSLQFGPITTTRRPHESLTPHASQQHPHHAYRRAHAHRAAAPGAAETELPLPPVPPEVPPRAATPASQPFGTVELQRQEATGAVHGARIRQNGAGAVRPIADY